MADRSEPASASEIAKAGMRSPATTPGRYFFLSASEPNCEMGPEPSPCMAKENSAKPELLASVSRMMQLERTSRDQSMPPPLFGTDYFSQPASPNFLMTLRQALSMSAPGSKSRISRSHHDSRS